MGLDFILRSSCLMFCDMQICHCRLTNVGEWGPNNDSL